MKTKTINREELLHKLEAVQPGLSARDVIEQAGCFVFKNGRLVTYNDEISCSIDSPLPKDFQGAVSAAPLLAILRKLQEDEIGFSIDAENNQIVIQGKGRKSGIKMDVEITLPIDSVETPAEDDWLNLPDNFSEIIKLVEPCAGKDENALILTCVNFTAKHIEACDDVQLLRYRTKLKINGNFLVKRQAIRHVVGLDMTEFKLTETWVHFRNGSGLIMSCRKYVEDYPSLDDLVKIEGMDSLKLPKGLQQAAENSAIFASENEQEGQLEITIQPDRLVIQGIGASGWYRESRKIVYSGPTITFLIPPKLLIRLINLKTDCHVSQHKLLIDGGVWRYATSLGQHESKSKLKDDEGGE